MLWSSFQMFTNNASCTSIGTTVSAAIAPFVKTAPSSTAAPNHLRVRNVIDAFLSRVRQLQCERSAVLPERLRQKLGTDRIGVGGAEQVADQQVQAQVLV